MVEESTAATHALKGEAGELSRLVGEFRTGDHQPISRPARSSPRPATSASRPAPSAPRRRTEKLAASYGGAAVAAAAPAPAADDWEEF
jgi:methyl-accepting chemotaxis protein